MNNNNNFRGFFVKIVLPTLLTFGLFLITIYMVIIPEFENNIFNRKREMIRELTNTAWSVAESFYNDEQDSIFSKSEAQARAISIFEDLRYGIESKDYFWVTNMWPEMIMHPYRQDLNGTDLSKFSDPEGKLLFKEFVSTVKYNNEGYVDYMWQWKDDSTRIVPKLSYVKAFKPWGWIIGTGIYLEDVREEIAVIKKRLLVITLVIILVIIILLIIITIQSYNLESRRVKAEQDLAQSQIKYKTLVQTNMLGTMMINRGSIIYSNKIIQDMLGYSEDELAKIYILNLLTNEDKEGFHGIRLFKDAPKEKEHLMLKHITQLKNKKDEWLDVEIAVTQMKLGPDNVFVLKIKELSDAVREFGESKNKFKSLTDNINIGLFRTTFGHKGKFIEANPALIKILGLDNEAQLFGANILDLFNDRNARNEFVNDLQIKRSVKNRLIRLKKSDGIITTIAVSAVLITDENGIPIYCDGIVEDITEQKQKEESQDNMIMELQTSLLFLNQPISHFKKDYLSCGLELSVHEAAKLMSKNNYKAILITTEKDDAVGIVTDHDVRRRLVGEGLDVNTPVYKIMSSPIIAITDRAMLYEGISMMQEMNLSHLGIKDIDNRIVSVVSNEELLRVHGYSLSFLIKEIDVSEDIKTITDIYNRLPVFLMSLLNSGAEPNNLTRISSVVFETIVKKLINFAIDELGKPPVAFSFIALGSAGRGEQTLATDQDNAIVYENVSKEKQDEVSAYFQKLGTVVCDWLNEVGYKFCLGDIMAKNIKWCQPLGKWKEYFTNWVTSAQPQDLLEVNIFFDFVSVYGDDKLTADLRNHISKLVEVHPQFFIYMAGNTLKYKPPINIFGKIVVGSTKEHPGSFDIKHSMIPITDMARIYSLKEGINETNTLVRYKRLKELGIISSRLCKERIETYKVLMQMRFRHQVDMIKSGKEPDNFIIPEELTGIEQETVKRVFGSINDFLNKLSFDFKGKA